MTSKTFSIAMLLALFAPVAFCVDQQPGVSPGPGTRYATDAYPGFDNIEGVTKPEKKEPRWFSWFTGPKMDNAKDQFAWAEQCEREGSYSKARRAYDALVRNWPSSPEAPTAQERVAAIYLTQELDYEEAFVEYRYLLDFYAINCDFNAVALKLYQIAELLRQEGKTIVFFRFKNTTDVRRAYEAVVLHAPGADFTPKAMLTIASLREDEGHYGQAVQVYENLRNLFPNADETIEAIHNEGRARIQLLSEHGYNDVRIDDTLSFLKEAQRSIAGEKYKEDFEKWLEEVMVLREEEDWRSASFYDSKTRTKRSALNAYVRYLKDHPDGAHAEKARARVEELKETK